MIWRVLVLISISMGVLACQSDGGSDCTDLDGDGFGLACAAGSDCDDFDPDNWDACATCLDADGDGSFAGCNAYSATVGPDCDDADVDNQSSCSTCVDADGDSSFVGCDQYSVRNGPDCDDSDGTVLPGAAPLDQPMACMRDADGDDWGDSIAPAGGVAGTDCDDSNIDISPGAAENQTGLGCVADLDHDGYGSTSAPAGGVAGTDCSDSDPNNFASCSSCADLDGDLSFGACDAYESLPGPDCDDADPQRSTVDPELADDGIDNDCSGSDLVAASAISGIFVDIANSSCTDGPGAGSQTTPFCSLGAAILSATAGGDLFVATGTYGIVDVRAASTGPLRIYGGYDSSWSRNISLNPTVISADRTLPIGLDLNAPVFILDGVEWNRTSAIAQTAFELNIWAESLASVTRSSFSLPTGDTRVVRLFRGSSPASENQGFAILSENDFSGLGGIRPFALDNFGTALVVRNQFENFGQANGIFVSMNSTARSFVLANAFYADRP